MALNEAEGYARLGRQGEHSVTNRRFHQAIYRACENTFVTRSLDDLQDLTALATTGVLWEKWPTWEDESREHWAIHGAAKKGNGARAAALMREHIEKSITRLQTPPR